MNPEDPQTVDTQNKVEEEAFKKEEDVLEITTDKRTPISLPSIDHEHWRKIREYLKLYSEYYLQSSLVSDIVLGPKVVGTFDIIDTFVISTMRAASVPDPGNIMTYLASLIVGRGFQVPNFQVGFWSTLRSALAEMELVRPCVPHDDRFMGPYVKGYTKMKPGGRAKRIVVLSTLPLAAMQSPTQLIDLMKEEKVIKAWILHVEKDCQLTLRIYKQIDKSKQANMVCEVTPQGSEAISSRMCNYKL